MSTKAKNTIPEYIAYLRVSKEDATTGSHTFETQDKRILKLLTGAMVRETTR
jgi:hypothetical protein